MQEIDTLLDGYSTSEKRSALYYLTRYIKQASSYEDYQKDLFVDDAASAPSEVIRTLTFRLIKLIEESANKKAAKFDGNEFHYWMDKIAEIEDNIDPQPNDNQVKKALDELGNFNTLKL